MEIKRNEKKVVEGDVTVTRQKLGIRRWNLKKPPKEHGESIFGIQMHEIGQNTIVALFYRLVPIIRWVSGQN